MRAVRHHRRRPQDRYRGVQADDQLPAVVLQSNELDHALIQEEHLLGREPLPEQVRARGEATRPRRLRGRAQQHAGWALHLSGARGAARRLRRRAAR